MLTDHLPLISHLLATTDIHIATQRVQTTWTWYVIRASGFTSASILILLMISGIGQVTGLTYKIIEPLKAWALHKALAITLCFSIFIHGSFLLIDHFIKFGLGDILVPFVSHYSNGTKFLGIPLGSLTVTLGILATYGVAIIVASSLGWIEKRKRAWKLLHYLTYLVALFVFLHALYGGTDLKSGFLRTTWIIFWAIVLVAVFYRLLRSGTIRQKTD